MPLFRSLGARKDAVRGTIALEVRQGLAGLLASAGGVAARPGVFAGAPTLLVTGTAGWNYSVAAAHFAVSRGASDGVHIFGNDGPTNIATGAAPGAGTSRIDVVWVRHPSNTENADTNSVPVFGCAQSLASATPITPTIPAGALELARNTVLSTATTTASAGNAIVQTFPWTALRGAPIPVRNQAERDTLTSLASASNPVTVDRIDGGYLETNAGAGWAQRAGFARTRELPVTISGPAAGDTPYDLAPEQVIPAAPFGARPYSLRVNASASAAVGTGLGIKLDVLLDGVVVGTCRATNAGTTANTMTVAVSRTVLVSDVLSHTVRAVFTPLAGLVTMAADTTRFFEIQATPQMAL